MDGSGDQPLLRRVVAAVAVLAVVVAVPVVTCAVLLGATGARDAAVGALFGLLLAVRTGWRDGLLAVPVLAVTVVVAGLLVGTVGWVLLLAGTGFVVGLASTRGAHVSVALVGVAAAVARPWGQEEELLAHAVLVAVAATWAVLVVRRLGAPARLPGPRLAAPPAVVAGVVLAAVLAAAGALALVSGGRFAYWLPMTVLLLVLPVPGTRPGGRARQRVVGTLAGVVVAALLAVAGPPRPVLLGSALVVVVAVLVVTRPLWVNAMLSSLVVVLVLEPGRPGLAVAEERLLTTLAAALLVVVGSAVLSALGSRVSVPTAGTDVVADLVEDRSAG